MGNFEKLSVLVIVVIIVMILVVALYTWTDSPQSGTAVAESPTSNASPYVDPMPAVQPPGAILPPAIVSPAGGGRTLASVSGARDPLTGTLLDGSTPVTPAAPVEEAKPEAQKHTIAKGDTLGGISSKYYGSSKHISEIQRANPDVNAMALRIGTVLTIPPAAEVKKGEQKDAIQAVRDSVVEKSSEIKKVAEMKPGSLYTVRKGDKLPEIARRTYGAIDRWPDVWLENYDKIEDPDTLIPGTRLKLPK